MANEKKFPGVGRDLMERMLRFIETTQPGSPEERGAIVALAALNSAPDAPPTVQPTQPAVALVSAKLRAPVPIAPVPALKVKHTRRARAPQVLLVNPQPADADDEPIRVIVPRGQAAIELEQIEGRTLPPHGSPLELTERFQTAGMLASYYQVSRVTIDRWLRTLPPQTYISAQARVAHRGPLSIVYKRAHDRTPKRRRD